MRYYRVEIGGDTPAVYTSWVDGQNDPGALTCEIDVTAYPLAIPAGNSFVKLWGISLQTISQATDFNFAPIKVFAGMSEGLPLAKPEQQGLIVQGYIYQAFGNWVGVNQTLDLIITIDAFGTQAAPKNYTFNWVAGTSLADAINQTLAAAAPEYALTISIDPKLKLPMNEAGVYSNMQQFAQYIKGLSISIIGGDYTGVEMTVRENEIIVYDGTTPTESILIDFVDLIGQPTWIGFNEVQFNTVMRADLGVNSYIRFPPTQFGTAAGSDSSFRNKSAFQGVFRISQVRHVGNSRQPDAQAWITTFNCYAIADISIVPS